MFLDIAMQGCTEHDEIAQGAKPVFFTVEKKSHMTL